MNIHCYRPGPNGAPLPTLARYLADLWPRLDAYEDSLTATTGFESCTLRLTTDLDEARLFLDAWLGVTIEVWGDDATRAWEGRIVGVEATAGGRTRSISLDPVMNAVRVRYTTALDTPGVTAPSLASASIARYGRRDGVVPVGKTNVTEATALAASIRDERDLPRAIGDSEAGLFAGASATGGGVQVTLTCAGWFDALGSVMIARTDRTEEAVTAQLPYLIGQFVAVNPFLAAAPIISTVGVDYTREIPPDTTVRQAIEQRLARPTLSGQRFAYGVYENRTFIAQAWAPGRTASARTAYRISGASGEIRLGGGSGASAFEGGAVVPWWRVRPDALLIERDWLSLSAAAAGVDASGQNYIERVTRRIDASGVSVRFEPAAATGLDARLARVAA